MMTSVLNIAHRGARSLAPENTIAAARKALEVGAAMWELDVGVTADGELIVIHDDTLTRTTNAEALFPNRAPWDISMFSLAEIKSLDAGSFFVETDPFGQIAAGAVSPEEQVAMRGEPVPTLEEALRFTRDQSWRVNVEIKTLSPLKAAYPVVERVLALISRFGMEEQALLSSFAHLYLQQAKRLKPELATAALVLRREANPITLLMDLEAGAYHPYNQAIDDQQIQDLTQAGFEVNVWTVNDEAEMEALIDAGVTGIITDFPQVLKQVLAR